MSAPSLAAQSESLPDNDSIPGGNELSIKPPFAPDSKKAVIYAAICPGLGQIYNRKYWKLPLVYGGFLGCYYAISWNNTQYNGYKNAYSDFLDNDTGTNSWMDYRPMSLMKDIDTWTESEKTWFSNSFLKNRKDKFRRYRDLSCIIGVGLYAVWIIDAYVDAELFNFDVSPDLSMTMQPVILERTAFTKQGFGLQCSFNF